VTERKKTGVPEQQIDSQARNSEDQPIAENDQRIRRQQKRHEEQERARHSRDETRVVGDERPGCGSTVWHASQLNVDARGQTR
jgi:hypothetical protein